MFFHCCIKKLLKKYIILNNINTTQLYYNDRKDKKDSVIKKFIIDLLEIEYSVTGSKDFYLHSTNMSCEYYIRNQENSFLALTAHMQYIAFYMTDRHVYRYPNVRAISLR